MEIIKLIEAMCDKDATIVYINSILPKAILSFGSETEDNIACSNNLEFGYFKKHIGLSEGLKTKKHDIPFSELAHTLEDPEEIPQFILDRYPEMDIAEWNAFTRFTTLLYVALERRLPQNFVWE